MSSGNLVLSGNPELFAWSSELDPDAYIFVTYRVCATCSGEQAALGMAMEQGVSTLAIAGYASPDMFEDSTIRICRIEPVDAHIAVVDVVPAYSLATEVYSGSGVTPGNYDIELAVPTSLVIGKPAQLLNVLVGELPRLGFLTSFRVTAVRLPDQFGPGPAFGREGILKLLDKTQGPILCRAMRPGVGVSLDVMARLNRDVLVGGFHLVKDDELICFADLEKYRQHLTCMLAARDEAMQRTGERKLYLANLICEPDELDERWELACNLGVDGVLVAPFIQGLGVLPALARQREIPLLAHNSFMDLMSRNPDWGLDDAVLCHWLRHLGADWFVTPGPFASVDAESVAHRRMMDSATGVQGKLRPMMPNVQGGKNPQGLPAYHEAVGDHDYMLIVAHWVDSHGAGLLEAAREFRAAVDAQQGG